MLSGRYERRIFVEEGCDVEELVSLTCTNLGPEEVSLDDQTVRFLFTEAETEGMGAWGPDRTLPDFSTERSESQTTIVVDTRGAISPGASATYGAHVRREQSASKDSKRLSLNERNWRDDFGEYDPTSVISETVVVFPASNYRRWVVAPGAALVSSRVAVWSEPLQRGRRKPLIAYCESGRIPHALRVFDDLLAECYRTIATRDAGVEVPVGWPAADIEGWLEIANEALPARAARGFDGFLRANGACSSALLQHLWALRPALERSSRAQPFDDAPVVADDVVVRVQHVHSTAEIPSPLSHGLADVIDAVLTFVADCQGGARRWREGADEVELHREVQTWMRAHSIACESEPEMNNGRIDLLAADVPIELKAGEFFGDPNILLEHHGQQAAEYAVRRVKGAGLLIGLDTSAPADPRHGPHLRHRVVIETVPASRPQGAGTVVLALLISANPQQPSRLRNPPWRRAVSGRAARQSGAPR